MARTTLRGLLLWLANLALLPGCLHFLPSGSNAPEEVRPRLQAVPGQKAEFDPSAKPMSANKPYSTAVPIESDALSKPKVNSSTLKELQAGPVDMKRLDTNAPTPVPVPERGPALEISQLPLPDLQTNKKGFAGVVTVPEKEPANPLQPITAQINSALPVLPQMPADEHKLPREHTALVEALRCILEKRPKEAIRHLEAYDKKTQDLFLRFLPMLTIFVETPIDELTPPQVAILNEQLNGLLLTLRPRSELVINKMCYCKRIHTYGVYEPLPDNHAFLAAGNRPAGEQVQLYVELKNFASEPTPQGDFLTKLACTLELQDTNRKVVWSHTYDRKETTHLRKTRLNDFYSNYSFYVPAIPAGMYQLTIQITDETIPELRRTVRKSLDFRVTPVGVQSALR